MPFYTVQQLKALVASIPASANTYELDVPPEVLWQVVEDRVTDASGDVRYTVRGYLDFSKRAWVAVP